MRRVSASLRQVHKTLSATDPKFPTLVPGLVVRAYSLCGTDPPRHMRCSPHIWLELAASDPMAQERPRRRGHGPRETGCSRPTNGNDPRRADQLRARPDRARNIAIPCRPCPSGPVVTSPKGDNSCTPWCWHEPVCWTLQRSTSFRDSPTTCQSSQASPVILRCISTAANYPRRTGLTANYLPFRVGARGRLGNGHCASDHGLTERLQVSRQLSAAWLSVSRPTYGSAAHGYPHC